MKKRVMAFILCVCIVATMFIPVAPVKALEDSAYIEYEGNVVEDIYISETEKKTVEAVFEGEALSYQWQILVDSENEIWASIYDKTAEECEISYALVKNILELSGMAFIRCKIVYDEGEAFTNHLSVSVYEEEDTVSSVEEEMILVSDMQIIEPEEIVEEVFEEEISEEEYSEEEVFEEEFSGEETEESVEETFEMEVFTYEAKKLLAAGEDGPVVDKGTTTVTINYLDITSIIEGNPVTSIYTSYTATVEVGSRFQQNVVSPTWLGFAPFLNGEGEEAITYEKDTNDNYIYYGGKDASVIELDFAEGDLTGPVVINVYYKPVKVPYFVRYFFQNINDDNYTEEAALYATYQDFTGTIVDDRILTQGTYKDGKEYSTGFTKTYHIPEAIASDGSTVFEVYYDRNYYLVEFDFNGGYGSDPIYARYGTPFVVNDPTRYGYVFDGWDLATEDTNGDGNLDSGDGIADTIPGTIPAKNSKYIAKWRTVQTTYTVVYWRENANDNNYTYWGSTQKNIESNSLVSGEDDVPNTVTEVVIDGRTVNEKPYFEFNPVLSDKNVRVEGNGTTVINVYYTRKYYTITFKDGSYNSCVIPTTHTHTDECYAYKCEGNHTHTDDCITCGKVPHKHSGECYSCGKMEHNHSDACYFNCIGHHTIACFTNQNGYSETIPTGNATTAFNYISNPQEGYIYRCRYRINIFGNYTYYNFFYIGGKWYYLGEGTQYRGIGYTGNLNTFSNNSNVASAKANYLNLNHTHSHTDDCLSCGFAENHSHTDCTFICTLQEHNHVSSCYECGIEIHDHDASCMRTICGLSETHTHNTNCTDTIKIVHRKYQQSVSDIWPVVDANGVVYDDGQRWSPSNSSYFSQVLVYIDEMPPDDFTLTVNTSTANYYTMNYYLQILPEDRTEDDVLYKGNYYRLYISNRARYNHITKDEDFFDIRGYYQFESDPSFGSGTSISPSDRIADFYYNRIVDHYLEFSNNGILMDDKKVHGIMYGESIKEYQFIPGYPENLEPNAYEFAGWYTSPGCYDGTEVNWDTITMPEGDLLLHAKWVPKTHEIRFFKTYDDVLAFEANKKPDDNDIVYDDNGNQIIIHEKDLAINHGETYGSLESNPTHTDENGVGLIFGGWFYVENGEKKAFSPTDFPVKRDMNIFADWSGESHVPFRIEYWLRGPDGNLQEKVADDYIGFARVSSTKTFNAKAGYPYNQLYPQFNGGMSGDTDLYFPINASHSITMKYDAEKDATKATENVYIFEYVKASIPINYKVRYVDKETGKVLGEENRNTRKAVETVRFKAFEDYVPDAFYKRLVLSVTVDENGNAVGNDEENIVTFYYTKNETSAYYAVHFMLEKFTANDADRNNFAIDGSGGYEESTTHIEGIGDIGGTVEIIPQTFSGFTLIPNKAVETDGKESSTKNLVNGKYEITVSHDGTELYIFYSRNKYPYDVYYLKYNSTEEVHPKKEERTELARYGDTIKETALEIPNYTLVSSETMQELLIHEEKKDSNGNWPKTLERNNIYFYYVQTEYVIEYVAVPPEGGTITTTIETVLGGETPIGSVATPNENYRFEGWYWDQECENVVSDDDRYPFEDETEFIPKTDKLHPNRAGAENAERNIFYAKFELLAEDFTIKRENATNDGQVFVYEIRKAELKEGEEDLVITVTIVGNGSVTIKDLPYGKYIITQKNGWSWRYDDVAQTIIHQASEEEASATFGLEEQSIYWLNGNSEIKENKRSEG